MDTPLNARLPNGWSAGTDQFGEYAAHPTLATRFRLLPRGVYRIGMSADELAAARRLDPSPNITVEEVTPVIEVDMQDVLIADRPISVRTAQAAGVQIEDGVEEHPAMLKRHEALAVAESLRCRLPWEAEWETCCRAGSSTLFVWGDELPPPNDLESWLSWDIEGADLRRNSMGVGGLFFGEWCLDEFRVSHAPDAEVLAGDYVVKGGGAQFWPWQNEEWVWCASAMRMPSSALFADQRCAARLVLDSL